MLSTVLGFGLLSTLGLSLLPVPRVRRMLLLGSARLVQAIMLALLGACGTFFIRPESAPDWLADVGQPILEGTRGFMPESSASLPGVPWLVLAFVAVACSLPILIVVELAAALSSQHSLVQSLRKEMRAAARWFDRRLEMIGVTGPAFPVPASEADYAARALGAAGHAAPDTTSPLVLQLLKK